VSSGDDPSGDDPVERRPPVAAVHAALGCSVVGSIGLLVAYWSEAGTGWQGAGLAVALGGLAVALASWALHAVPPGGAVEPKSGTRSTDAERAAAASAVAAGNAPPRRSFLALAGLAGAALVAALVSPLRSLGPSPFPARRRTGWGAGVRLVGTDGRPIRADDLTVGTTVTALPEGVPTEEAADAQVMVVRMDPAALRLGEERRTWSPEGIVAYSKVCTHAGCPVGLYDADTHELLCPCHQSVFLATESARPVFGPASRRLPQLPLAVDGDGHLTATGDFPEPVGPGYWSQP
jgi:ubiquinol-cytochrome c reductase iron-sulfur subunit